MPFPNLLTPRPPALLRDSGEPRKEPGNGERCGKRGGGRAPARLGSVRAPSRTTPGTSGEEEERKDPLEERTSRKKSPPARRGTQASGRTGGGGGDTQNPTQPNANDTDAYILLLAVTSRLVLEAGPAAFLLQWTRGLAGSAVLLAALGAQEATRFGGNGERAGGVDLPAEPLVQ